MRRSTLGVIALAFILAGCTSGLTVVKRGSSEMGTGHADAVGQTLSAQIGGKTCSGEYTTVANASGTSLLTTYGGDGGVSQSYGNHFSDTGRAMGIMTCSDGDVWRCEVAYAGTAGYGVCVSNRDGTVYDVMAK